MNARFARVSAPAEGWWVVDVVDDPGVPMRARMEKPGRPTTSTTTHHPPRVFAGHTPAAETPTTTPETTSA